MVYVYLEFCYFFYHSTAVRGLLNVSLDYILRNIIYKVNKRAITCEIILSAEK
jgi:hypothetical protein